MLSASICRSVRPNKILMCFCCLIAIFAAGWARRLDSHDVCYRSKDSDNSEQSGPQAAWYLWALWRTSGRTDLQQRKRCLDGLATSVLRLCKASHVADLKLLTFTSDPFEITVLCELVIFLESRLFSNRYCSQWGLLRMMCVMLEEKTCKSCL